MNLSKITLNVPEASFVVYILHTKPITVIDAQNAFIHRFKEKYEKSPIYINAVNHLARASQQEIDRCTEVVKFYNVEEAEKFADHLASTDPFGGRDA